MPPITHDIKPGKRYGWLVVQGAPYRGERGDTVVDCRCACGTIKVVASSDLRRGRVVSCGCKRRAHPWAFKGPLSRREVER